MDFNLGRPLLFRRVSQNHDRTPNRLLRNSDAAALGNADANWLPEFHRPWRNLAIIPEAPESMSTDAPAPT